MSEQLGKLNPVDRVLKQSLLNLKDQMSVYSTQPWTAENGHGYNEAEQFAMREGPMMVGRGPNTRQPNPMERRRNTEHEIDLHSLTNVQCRFENPRNKLPGPPGNAPPPGVEYGHGPPGRPPGPMPVENGYRDDNFRRDNRPYIDIDRSRTDPAGYYKGQGRPQYVGPEAGRSYHAMEGGGGYPPPAPYEGDVGGPRNEFRHLPSSAVPRGLLPHPIPDDRNQGLRRGFDSYSSSPSGSSWSPTDGSGSPNAYPPPPPSRLRHSESFPPDARRASFTLDRPSPYNHPPPPPHLNNRSPTDGQWRAEAQRRHARSHPDDDYLFPRRVDFIGLPPYHLRDPRLNRGPGVPSPSHPHSHSRFSPQPHNQAPQSTTSSPRINSPPTRRSNVSQILNEHSYFEKCEPSEVPSNTCSKTATPQQESQVDGLGLPGHMLSPVPRVYSVIMNKSASPLNSGRTEGVLEKAYISIEPRGSLPTSKELKDVLALVASSSAAAESKSISEEATIKQDSKNIAISGVVKEVKKEPPVSAQAKESPCASDEESDQLMKDDELNADPQNDKTPDSGYPDSPAVSLSGFDLDLDREPMSGTSSDEEDDVSETDQHNEEEILQLAPTSFVSNTRKSRKTDTTTQEEVEAEPSKISQSNSRVLRNRILPCSSTSTSHTIRRQPVAVLDNKVPSLRLPLSRDGILHSKIEDSLKQQPRMTRRSKRLATSQDNVAENSEEKADETAPPKVSVPIDSTESSQSAKGATENPSLRTSVETTAKEMTKEERMLLNMANARAAKASKEKRRSRRLFSGHRKRTQSGQSKKQEINDDMDELALQRPKRRTTDFVPEILPTKSRTETATLQRRKQMQKEIEQHEKERLETARPGEDDRLRSPSPLIAEPPDSLQEDDVSTESVTTGSMTTASSSRDMETASKGSSLLDEFSSDIALRCKRISSQRSCSGDTPLHKVGRTGKYDMARYLLLIEKLPVNVQDYAGWTPLHEACSSSNTRVAELLLQHGADANISATDGTRPIHDAIEVGAFDLVKLLIQYGADPLAEQGEKTPAEFALDMEQPEIHAYLQSVIEERRAQQSKLAQTSSSQPAVAKTPVRKVEEKKQNEICEDAVMIPVDGYSDDDPKFGDELDHPLFYVSPIIEMSDEPLLPDVYNLEIVSGRNPRRHNFHLLGDVLKALKISESELRRKCHGIRAVELPVADIKVRLKNSFVYGNSVPCGIRSLPSDTKVKLVPLCTQLRSLFDIEVENMDI